MVILYKKGDKTDIKNNQPISLLQVIYKIFFRILTRSMTSTLNLHQKMEQAGIRNGFLTINHQAVSQLMENDEHNIPLCIAVVLFSALEKQESTQLT